MARATQQAPRSAVGGQKDVAVPAETRSTIQLLDALFEYIKKARIDPAGTLHTGLSLEETREMLKTRDTATAIRLVWNGLAVNLKLPQQA